MDNVNLKPCPFCGGSAVVSFRGKPENGGFFVVGCTTCRASMVGGYYRGSSDELYKQPYPLSEMVGASKAIENWNRRANDALSLVLHLEAELAATKLERDAAVRGLHGDCETCKHYETENCAYCVHDPDAWSAHEDNWEWEGFCPENTEASPDD